MTLKLKTKLFIQLVITQIYIANHMPKVLALAFSHKKLVQKIYNHVIELVNANIM